MQLEIPSRLGYSPKSFNLKGYDAQAKIFYQFTLLSNNHVLISYLSGIYLESWFSWLGRGLQKTWEKKKTDRRKTLKNEEKEKWKIQGKSNNNNKHLWFYILHKKLYFARKNSLKKAVYTITFYSQFLCVAAIWNAVITHQSLRYINIQITI